MSKSSKRSKASTIESWGDFVIGDRVKYKTEEMLIYSQQDMFTKKCPTNEFVILSFLKDPMVRAELQDVNGIPSGYEELDLLTKL